jgi:signal transduction histidine kinase
MAKLGDRSLICPHTGLPVIERDDWTNIRLHEAYQMTIRILDGRILSIHSEGDLGRLDADKAFPIRNRIIEERFGNKPYVELRSYERLHGMLTSEQRRKHAHYWLHSPGKMMALILYSVPVHIRMAAHIGKRVFHSPIQMAICKNYTDAVNQARRVLIEHSPPNRLEPEKKPISADQLVDDPRWQYESPKSGAYFRNAVIPHRLFYSTLGGKFTVEDCDEAVKRIESIFEEGWLSNDEIYRIADYTEVINASFRARKNYAKALHSIYTKYRCLPLVTYVCGASFFMRSALLFGQREVEQNFVFIDSVDTAFASINQAMPPQNTLADQLIAVRQSDLDDLVRATGSFVWRTDRSVKIPKGSPFERVYEALELIRNDLHEAQAREDHARSEAERLAVQAEAVSRTKNELLVNANNEIRGPMNVILDTVDRFSEVNLSPEQKSHLDLIRKNSREIGQLLGGMGDLSMLDRTKVELENVPFDLVVTMDDTMEMLAPSARHAGLDLHCLVDPRVPSNLLGDPVRLRQVLIQLIGNALKFTPHGEVDVRVLLEEKHPREVFLKFSIRDTGVGIPKDRQAMLFHAMGRTESPVQRGGGKSGMGLLVARQLVSAMNGRIGVESAASEGSTFWFTVGFQIRDEMKSRHSLPSQRVLIVEESATSRFVLTTLLSAWGCRIEIAGSASKALECLHKGIVQSDPIAVVIVNQALPDLTVAEFVHKIRSGKGWEKTKLVLLSRSSMPAVEESLAFDAKLTQPLRQRALFDCMDRLLGEESAVMTQDDSGV